MTGNQPEDPEDQALLAFLNAQRDSVLSIVEGLDEEAIARRYGVDVWQQYGRDLEPFLENGLLTRQDRRIRLTRRGMLLANEVMAVFV